MRKKIEDWIEQYRHMDWAVLCLRLFVGGMMLFHNIGKMQNYNEIINSYPSLLYLNNQFLFVVVAVAEVLLSLLIIMGLWVRVSALLMALGVAVALAWGGFMPAQTAMLWLGIYVFLVVSGGGLYAFDTTENSSKTKK